MFFGIDFFSRTTTRPHGACGESSSATYNCVGSREHSRINRDTRVRHVAATSGVFAAEQTRALAHGRRMRQPSWKRICVNIGLFAIGAGFYCTYMYLQFRRLRRS